MFLWPKVSDTQLDTAGYFPRTASGKRGVSARVYEVGKAEKNWMVKAIAKKCRKNKKTLCSTEIVCYTRS